MKEKMKNTIRRVLSVFAAIAMVLGVMGANVTPVMADEGNGGTYTITVKNAQPGRTYTLYKIFNATTTADRQSGTSGNQGIAYNYTMTEGKSLDTEYDSTIDGTTNKVKGSDWFVIDPAGNVTAKTDANVTTLDFRNWATQFGTKVGDTKTVNGEATSLTFSNLTDGYYFITSNVGSLITLTSIAPNQEVSDKNTAPLVDKTEDVKTSSVGESVTYTTEVSLPSGSTNVIFHDRMGTGLELQGNTPDSITVDAKDGTALKKDEDYTVDYFRSTPSTADNKTNKDNITISFKESYLTKIPANSSKTVYIVYKAKLTEQASINMPNEAYVSYGDNSSSESTHKSVYESSFGFVVNKITTENDTIKNLSGAKFAIAKSKINEPASNINEKYVANNSNLFIAFDNAGTYAPDGTTKVFEAGNVKFKGLNDNENNDNIITYYLYEVTAPDGYEKLTGPVEIQIEPTFANDETASHGTRVTGYKVKYKLPGSNDFNYTTEKENDISVDNHVININNTKGVELPSTGGIGTTIFYVIGGVVVAGAIVLLIARRKKNA